MKKTIFLLLYITITTTVLAQRPSKEQMEADKKKLAEAMKKLNEKTAQMDPTAKRHYDSMLHQYGVGPKIDDAVKQVNNYQPTKSGQAAVGLIPAKDNSAIASIAATPATATMGAFIGSTGNSTFAAVLPAAKNKANEIYNALKSKGAKADEMGNAATVLWMDGRTEIALSLMAQVCKDNTNNTDNLNNYAAMLTMMGAPELAVPILTNLNARFKNNSTILNNLGQAWFALGDMDKATKYLDSTLLLAPAHAQANETRCLIDESKGNKTAAAAHAKAAFKQGTTRARRDKLMQQGYTPGPGDYSSFPPANKSDDLLNLGGFAMPAFPKSVAECRGLAPTWKQFRADIDQRLKSLQKITEESNKTTTNRLQQQQQQFLQAKNKVISNPGAVNVGTAMQIMGTPIFSEKMNAREKTILENLQRKKQNAVQQIVDFVKGDGAKLKKAYEDAKKGVDAKVKEAEKNSVSQTVDPGAFCSDYAKVADDFLKPYNTQLEGLYNQYLAAEKQLLNEISYSSLYTTYPELLPGLNAGLQMQWLRDLSLTQNGMNFEVITKYDCEDAIDGKNGRLTAFKDPHCNINSEFGQSLGLANLGFKITLNCSGMTTEFNALIFGITLNQDLDHAGFGDSFKSCTVSIGPKTGVEAKMGPVAASAKVGAGVDIEIDRTGITDVIVKGSLEAEANILDHRETSNPKTAEASPLGASAGVEGRMSLNTGAGSINGTGIFK